MPLTHTAYCDAIATEVDRFADATEGAAMHSPVPGLLDALDKTAPLTLAGLIVHLGSIHRWATKIVAERLAQPISPRSLELGLPGDTAAYPSWLRAGGQALADALRAADPDEPVWAWGPDQHVRWWARRQVHETMVHRADGERALGRQPAIDPGLAVDGVDEFLDNLPHASFAQRVKNLKGSGSLHLHCTDAHGEWLIQLTQDGFTSQRGHAKADVAVRGSATDLLLLVWGRHKPPSSERFEIFGDAGLLDFWLANSAV